MASLGHVAVGVALGRAWNTSAETRARFGAALLLTGLAVAPDADTVGFALGIPYAHPLGHRGASHSLVMAAVVSVALALLLRGTLPFGRTALFAFLALGSHSALDAFTDGGLGAALFWPFTSERYFAPLQPIPVAPIGAGMLSARGVYVLLFELAMFSPLVAYGLWPRARR